MSLDVLQNLLQLKGESLTVQSRFRFENFSESIE